MNMTWNGANGLKIPRWFITAIIVAAALIGLGIQIAQTTETLGVIDNRLCRLERAAEIDPWVSCRQ